MQRAVVDGAAFVGVVSVVLLVVALLLGLRPVVVVSGSMEPEIPVGALVVTRVLPAGDVEVGDVVTVPRPRGDGLVTHRVVSTSASPDEAGAVRLELKGDANAHPDPTPVEVAEVERVVLALGGLGTVVLGLQENVGVLVAALLAGAVLVSVPVGRARREGAQVRSEGPSARQHAGAGPVEDETSSPRRDGSRPRRSPTGQGEEAARQTTDVDDGEARAPGSSSSSGPMCGLDRAGSAWTRRREADETPEPC